MQIRSESRRERSRNIFILKKLVGVLTSETWAGGPFGQNFNQIMHGKLDFEAGCNFRLQPASNLRYFH